MQQFNGFNGFDTARYGQLDASAIVQRRSSLLGKVLALLGFGFLFTCAGIVIGSSLGPGSYFFGLIGGLMLLFALMAAREKSPINLILLYAFCTMEGIFIGPVIDTFLAHGMGAIVLDAAAGTAGITLLAGSYGFTTRRNLLGIGRMLFFALIGIIIAAVIGLFLQLPALYLIVSMAMVAVFTGYIMYDLQRLSKTAYATEGDAIMFAVSLYLDMFNIFIALLNILSILGGGGFGGSRRSG